MAYFIITVNGISISIFVNIVADIYIYIRVYVHMYLTVHVRHYAHKKNGDCSIYKNYKTQTVGR